MATIPNSGQGKGDKDKGLGEEIKYYRIDNLGVDPIGYFVEKGKLPEGLEEITERDYLFDRTGKTICYGISSIVAQKVKTKFGLIK